MPVRPLTMLLCLALAAPALAADPSKPAVKGSEPAPLDMHYPPAPLRPYLRQRMAQHGDEMMKLVGSVILLERPLVKAGALRLAQEPRLARPILGGEEDLNTVIPERFFVLQDELRNGARALAESADHGDDALLARRFGELSATCVSCHSAFLPPDAQSRPAQKPQRVSPTRR